MGKIKKKILVLSIILDAIFLNMFTFASSADVDAPTLTEVRSIVGDGLDLFFGALGAFAVIMGGIELYGAFMAHRENVEQGGFGRAQNKVQDKVIAGVMCLIAASIIFIVMRWTQGLFDLA